MNVFQNFKQIAIIFLLLIGSVNSSDACDILTEHSDFEPQKVFCDLCGCATSSGSFGYGTLGNSNFIGVRYMYQNYESKNGIFENSPISKETFNTYQIWAQVPIKDSFFVNATIPYQYLNRSFNGIDENLNGLGDISVIGWYKYVFYKDKKSDNIDFSVEKENSGHSVQIGLGAKLPTGKFEERLADNINPGFQVGTGSLDVILSAGYNYAGNKIGLNTLISYYAKSENKNEYKFGDQFSYATNLYTLMAREKMKITPFIGVSGDVYGSIEQYGQTLNATNGSILNATLGTELTVKTFIFGASYTLPLYQNLFDDNVQSKQRISLYFNVVL
ncbi:MAG: hypothetical protein ACSHW7_12850 [Patiriisocius sp.]|uniref:hypothetical protein n=1 Tax=Patiriisocius sp. TaxID=2822396 RepID=UPI003EFAD253